MRIVEYKVEGNNSFYDFTTIKDILKIDRSKLQRELRKISGTDLVKYKNQYLYKKEILFNLMEKQLYMKLDKIEEEDNELQEDKID